DALRINRPHASQQSPSCLPGDGWGEGLEGPFPSAQDPRGLVERDRCDLPFLVRVPSALDQRRWSAVAQAEAWAAMDTLEIRYLVASRQLARDVVAHVQGKRASGLEREPRVEADHSISLGGWYRKTAARVL